MAEHPILIVGAGPTGLILALSLARRGIPFRLISEADGPGEHSRAMVVQTRTLEFYDQLSFADEVIEQGSKTGAAHLLEAGREVVSFSLRELGEGLSPFPFALTYAQDDHERFLIGQLAAAGGKVEWRSQLVGFTQDANGIHASISCSGNIEEFAASYICGCDGAHSRVREALGIGFPGGTYEQLFFVADVKLARGFEQDLYISLDRHFLALMFPVRTRSMQRLIGLAPVELSKRDLSFADIRSFVEPRLGITVAEVNWFSIYRVHHRVAEHFQINRAFLLGDAGHIHSPVGGQGMNTGIGDAVNLGWKLAQVHSGSAAAELLDSYEPERIGFARRLVATTDRAFTLIVAEGFRGEFIRKIAAPVFFALASRFSPSRHAMFRLVSQTGIRYPDSPLSAGKAGKVRGGDRLPWVRNASGDNYAALRSLEWQLHIYGNKDGGLEKTCRELKLPLHIFPWDEPARHAGLRRDAAYLLRPDGHVALALPDRQIPQLNAFIDHFKLRFNAHPPSV